MTIRGFLQAVFCRWVPVHGWQRNQQAVYTHRPNAHAFRTIKAFESCEGINEIIVVMNKSDIERCQSEIIGPYSFKKVAAVIEGGQTRQESGYRGICSASKRADIIIVHDGARPFVDNETIMKGISAAAEYGASCAVPAKTR